MPEPFGIATPDGGVGGLMFAPADAAPAAPLVVCIHGSGCTGRYFDLAGNSLAQAAAARGMPVLLADRPGHGASGAAGAGAAIDDGASAVAALVQTVRSTREGMATRPLALIGHSFGGAVAMVLTTHMTQPPPVALCVSGIGDRPASDYAAMRAASDAAARPAPYWLFGPGSSYDWRGVTALRAAVAPWRAEEVDEIVRAWPARWAAVAGAIACPVHLRLAQYERIWQTDDAAMARIEASFGAAARVNAAIAPDGGHLYEAHLSGPALVSAQLDFIAAAAGVA